MLYSRVLYVTSKHRAWVALCRLAAAGSGAIVAWLYNTTCPLAPLCYFLYKARSVQASNDPRYLGQVKHIDQAILVGISTGVGISVCLQAGDDPCRPS